MSLPKPYYEHDGQVIYHADCREILPELPKVDLVLTDPPYGIGADVRQAARANKQHGKALAPSRDYGVTNWDSEPPSSETMQLVLAAAPLAIIWGGNYFGLRPTKGWLIWDKETGNNGYADAEIAWSNLDQAIRLIRHRWMGMLKAKSDDGDERVHPTQKPVPVMKWCLGFVPDAMTILDPFMGSGTTLRAAKDLRRKAIGIEIEEKYCELAAKRLSQAVFDFTP